MPTSTIEREKLDSNEKLEEAVPSETTHLLQTNSEKQRQTNRQQHETKQLIGTTVALAFTLLVQSYLLVSVFPYSGFMAMFLIPGLNEETAGGYAGLIASSFMLGRTFSSFEWGKAADIYGRVFVIRVSLLLSAAFSILFGLAPTIYTALFWRFILGLCNGLIGPIKTIVSEVARGDEKQETRMMALVLGMWGYGFLLNPAIGGYLSDPVKQYPKSTLVQTLEPLLRSCPFLLPNIVGCLFCLSAYFLVGNLVEETLPAEKIQSLSFGRYVSSRCPSFHRLRKPVLLRKISSWGLFKHLNFTDDDKAVDANHATSVMPKWISPSPSGSSLVLLSKCATSCQTQEVQDSEVSNEMASSIDEEEPATIRSLWERYSTRSHLMVYWFYSFLIVCIDETFPLYCISKDSGLAIQEKTIGNILSGTGLVYISMQYFMLTGLVSSFGMYNSLRIGASMSIPLCCLIPLSLTLNTEAPEGHLTWSALIFLSAIYAIIRAFSSVTFSTLTMTTNKTVPAHHRATMNGFSMLGGSLAKAAGPTFAGILFSSSVGHVVPPFGSLVAYILISILGVCLVMKAWSLGSPETH